MAKKYHYNLKNYSIMQFLKDFLTEFICLFILGFFIICLLSLFAPEGAVSGKMMLLFPLSGAALICIISAAENYYGEDKVEDD